MMKHRNTTMLVIAAAALLIAALPIQAQETEETVELSDSGAWNWYGNPRGLYDDGRLITGWVRDNGSVQATQYNLETGEKTTNTLITADEIKSGGEIDDHNNPSFFKTSDGRYTTFFSGHNEDDMFYRVSTNPNDASQWGGRSTIGTNVSGNKGYTYPQAFALPGETDKVFLAWRGADWNPTYSIGTYDKDDQSWTWTNASNYISGNNSARPYTLIKGNEDSIGMVFTDSHPRGSNNNLYYAAIRRDDGGNLVYARANGTTIGKLSDGALNRSDAEKIFDRSAAPDADNCWGWDIAFDSDDRPVVTYATFVPDEDHSSDESYDTHQYRYARWDGSEWQEHTLVTDAGGTIANLNVNLGAQEDHYSGGISLDPSNPDIVYLSQKVDGQFEIQQWITEDAGETWTTRTLTSTPADEDVRPFVPVGLPDDLQMVIWMSGQYDYWAPRSPHGEEEKVDWDTSVQVWVHEVPEPATMSLLTIGGAGALLRKRR
jgi:hypothetical protein